MAGESQPLRNLIDGDPATGDGEDRRPCSTRPPARSCGARRSPRSKTWTAAVAAARRAFEDWSQTHARRALAGAAGNSGAARAARRGVGALGGAQRGQADPRRLARRAAGDGRQPALLRRRRALHGGQGRRRVHGGPHLLHAPRGGRRDRPDHALELPADDGHLEDRAQRSRRATRSCSSRPRRRR